MIQIELEKIPSQEIQCILGEQECTMWIYYRWGRMYLDLYVGDNVVFTGLVCNDRSNIIAYSQDIFKGYLCFVDLRGQSEPNYEEFNDRFAFLYFAEDEELPDFMQVADIDN